MPILIHYLWPKHTPLAKRNVAKVAEGGVGVVSSPPLCKPLEPHRTLAYIHGLNSLCCLPFGLLVVVAATLAAALWH